jgi:hypothetical protein
VVEERLNDNLNEGNLSKSEYEELKKALDRYKD